MNRVIFVFFGPSGSGKSTIIDALIKRQKIPLQRIITSTTRSRRRDEPLKRDRRFLSRDEFEKQIKRGDFFEWTKFSGNYYGSSTKDMENALKKKSNIVLDLEVKGVKTIKKKFSAVFAIFIKAPKRTIISRLKNRGANQKEIKTRMLKYDFFMRNEKLADFSIRHDDVDTSVIALEKIMINAAKDLNKEAKELKY